MGKRKAKLLQPKKAKLPKLDKEFECPFCSHLRSVLVKMDRGRGVASLSCRICGASFDKRINRLDEAVDVYGAWIDACVAANAQAAEQAKKRMASLGVGGGAAGGLAGERNNGSIAGGGVDSGGVGAGNADKIERAGAGGRGTGDDADAVTPGNGLERSSAGTPTSTPPRHAAHAASSWAGRHREAAGGAAGEEDIHDANRSNGRGTNSSSKRPLSIGGAGGSGSTAAAAAAVAAAAAGGSRLRRLRLERHLDDYSSSEDEDEADDDTFEFSDAARDKEQHSGSGDDFVGGNDEGGGAGALDVLTRLREQQREEEEDDTEAGAGDLFGDDE